MNRPPECPTANLQKALKPSPREEKTNPTPSIPTPTPKSPLAPPDWHIVCNLPIHASPPLAARPLPHRRLPMPARRPLEPLPAIAHRPHPEGDERTVGPRHHRCDRVRHVGYPYQSQRRRPREGTRTATRRVPEKSAHRRSPDHPRTQRLHARIRRHTRTTPSHQCHARLAHPHCHQPMVPPDPQRGISRLPHRPSRWGCR